MRGGTAIIISKSANIHSPNSNIYLCDTFEGVVKAGEHDNRYVGGEHADTSEESVQKLINKFSLNNTQLLKGIFPDDTGHIIFRQKNKILPH